MILRKSLRARRAGATTVETAVVIMIVLSMVLGIFEFCRMLMVWNLLDNAVRNGGRYALVNNTSSTVASDTTTMVTGGTLANGTVVPNRMAGQNTSAFKSGTFTVTVSGVHNGTTYTGRRATPWSPGPDHRDCNGNFSVHEHHTVPEYGNDDAVERPS